MKKITKLFGSWFRYPDQIARIILKSFQFLNFKKQVVRLQMAKDLSKNVFEFPQFPVSGGDENLKSRRKWMAEGASIDRWSEPWVKWENNGCSFLKNNVPGRSNSKFNGPKMGICLAHSRYKLGRQYCLSKTDSLLYPPASHQSLASSDFVFLWNFTVSDIIYWLTF